MATTTTMRTKRTTYAVWEITLKCNLACSHCGSRAGEARKDELSTTEAFDLVAQMADAGIREITLIGGEAFLRHDWLDIAREINRKGMLCSMTTGGYGVSRETAQRMKDAGIAQVSVSIDGLPSTHDHLRGKVGSFHFAFKTMEHLKNAGVSFGTNTQINRLSAPELPLIYEKIREAGAVAWQVQLTVPMGNAADHAEILLQPHELLDLYPMLAYLTERSKKDGIQIQPGNNIGYYGPYERLLRGRGKDDPWAFWTGCQAGLAVLGIEADGAIKGCPSLPTNAYTGGNIRDRSLRDIIENTAELTFNMNAGTDSARDHLWGFCAGCDFADLCRGGCSWTAHVFFDKRGNNPYCHHRALVQASKNIREETRLLKSAEGKPFDNGMFELSTVPADSAETGVDPFRFDHTKIRWPEAWLREDADLLDFIPNQRERAISAYRRGAA
jgi:nif11-class peptide radical SAM maturase 3